ncbi:MAG: ATP-binding cassette domain-containing protein [Comamonadaceae bacterium]|nr:ATP-binding cassette domain-containing protein [Comamonadaceae bacterium]
MNPAETARSAQPLDGSDQVEELASGGVHANASGHAHAQHAAALVVQAVSHRYGPTLALDAVSLTIPRGATVGLIGPDGVGKSTLLGLMAGVRRIQSGTVQVLGGDMADPRTRQRLAHRIAYMPQGLGKNLYPTLSVRENVDFHARLFGLNATERAARIRHLLAATGLAPFAARAAGKLSGGMKQKLSLCCALVHAPELLILDEPTTGVDPLSRRQFWALVRSLRAQTPQMTVIVATAYIDEAEQFEHLLAMDAGRLLANCPTREVMAAHGATTLEAAYIAMLPPEKRQGVGSLHITPFVPDPHSPPAIEAQGLTKRFGRFTAVENVSFRIEKGEIFGFLGANGCGKSTTMKMLTGLLDASAGSARLLGRPVDASDRSSRLRVGYMSQAFSLYEELTVRQNLQLHARLYQMGAAGAPAVRDALQQFDLQHVADTRPEALPLGMRQRLQLAAACLHRPEVLILDEPTSGVDPAARDLFWRMLLRLSRQERMTIFVSTHFMNEVERCDRMSLMNRGRVLVMGTPAEVLAQSGQANTEEAFIHFLQQDAAREAAEMSAELGADETDALPGAAWGGHPSVLSTEASEASASANANANANANAGQAPCTEKALPAHPVAESAGAANAGAVQREGAASASGQGPSAALAEAARPARRVEALPVADPTCAPSRDHVRNHVRKHRLREGLATVWTFALREAKELLRDPIRLFFAVMGPLIMLAAVGWSISYDVSDLRLSLLDRDQSAASRRLAESFRGSAYFAEGPPIPLQASPAGIAAALQNRQADLVLELPPGFGRDLALGRQPQIALYIDGTDPFNANTAAGYAAALLERYQRDLLAERGIELPTLAVLEPRFVYNPDFKSTHGVVPNILVLVLVMIPAIMTALAVVREREIGSIANLYASPATVAQYLLGKQLPYLAMGLLNFVMLTAMVVFWFGVPLKGSFLALLLGALLLVGASTGLGLLVSSFTRSQTAAFFIAALGTMIPTLNFSGIIHPLSSMEGSAYAIGVGFPAAWFQRISSGGFAKGLGLGSFGSEYAMLALFGLLYLGLASRLLKKQEK